MSLTLEQKRIAAAYRLVEKVPEDKFSAWKTVALGLGAEVQRCGLLQTLAFLQRNEWVAETLSNGIREHIVERGLISAEQTGPLLLVLRNMDADLYMLVTREALALSLWLKRATQAHSKSE